MLTSPRWPRKPPVTYHEKADARGSLEHLRSLLGGALVEARGHIRNPLDRGTSQTIRDMQRAEGRQWGFSALVHALEGLSAAGACPTKLARVGTAFMAWTRGLTHPTPQEVRAALEAETRYESAANPLQLRAYASENPVLLTRTADAMEDHSAAALNAAYALRDKANAITGGHAS